ncbi:SusC/RagA family TonB-linked outer membrane protein [Sphingobacterium griseoflavum]|nr:TonB-dependent receptor [Sphingobacterium griseoflavum]
MRLSLTAVLMTIMFLQISIAADGQSISLHERDAKLKDVLKKIRTQSGINFIYVGDVLEHSKPVNIVARKRPVQEVLEETFKDQPITYRLKNGTIILQRKTASDQAERVEIKLADIKGKVVDVNGEPLAGASIKVKGQDISTSTDVDGNFSLAGLPQAAVLIVSYIGYETQELAAISTAPMTITLVALDSELGEVVVVGYGTQKKSELIGSVSQVNADRINNRTVPLLSQALTGQMPGVSVIQRSGQPGASGGTIRVRGVTSVNASNNPLVLIDGIPGTMNNVDPNDVASISVLKDASSAAIYGARAANGVVLVTTKTGGQLDQLRVAYNGSIGLQRLTATPEMVNSWEFAQALNEAQSGSFSPEEIELFRNGSDPDNYPNVNHLAAILKPSALQTAHNVNISNKTKSGQYALSLGYLDQDGILEKNNFKRYNVRLNLVSNLSDKLTLTSRLSAALGDNNQPTAPATLDIETMTDLIGQALRFQPRYAIRLGNGDYGPGHNQQGTPLAWMESGSFYRRQTAELGANLRLDWKVIDGLQLSAIGGYTQDTDRNRRFRSTLRINDSRTLGPSTLAQNSNYERYNTGQLLAEYNKVFGDHNVSMLAGYSYESFYRELMGAARVGFASNDLPQLILGGADNQRNSGRADAWALQSFFGRFKYNYANRYLLESVVRYDGSSRFPPAQKYGFFPSLAIGWNLAEESFLKDKWSGLDELRLKGSFGMLGNQNILLSDGSINYYPYQEVLNAGAERNYPFGGAIRTGVMRSFVPEVIIWESTRTVDVGLVANLWKGLLGMEVGYFKKNTYNLLMNPGASVSNVLGFTPGAQNSGRSQNVGWEFNASHRYHIGQVNYSLSGNLTLLQNKMLDLGVGNVNMPNGMVGNGSSLFINHPLELYYGYVADGLFVDQADVSNWHDQTAINADPQPGDIRYRDISGPDGVPDGKVDPIYDRVVLGSLIPKYSFAFNLGADYKGFDLAVMLQGVAGVSGYLNSNAGFGLSNSATIQRWQFDERWTSENPDRNAGYPRMQMDFNTTPNAVTSSFWLLNGRYLRLKNVQLGYTLPKDAANKIGLGNLRMYVNGENLHTWSGYRPGWDPEINTGGAYYPILQNFTFGVNVNF